MGFTGTLKKLIKAVTILSNLPYLRATTPLRTKKCCWVLLFIKIIDRFGIKTRKQKTKFYGVLFQCSVLK